MLASGPLLMDDGHTCSWEMCDSSFIATKHPRSAIFTTKDKKTILITVDGRSKGNAIGVSIPELAHLIRILGGVDALNLDGGGSTTLWMKNAPDNGEYLTSFMYANHNSHERRKRNTAYLRGLWHAEL